MNYESVLISNKFEHIMTWLNDIGNTKGIGYDYTVKKETRRREEEETIAKESKAIGEETTNKATG